MKGIYLVFGYPDEEVFTKAVEITQEIGFDFVEIGVPFSDPVADGPILSAASQKSLKKGVNTKKVLEWLKENELKMDVYIMTYANIVIAYGPDKFSRDFLEAGVKGCIIADLPNEEHIFLKDRGFEMPLIPFATPESRISDLELIAERTRDGFIYFVSMRGTTGGDFSLEDDVIEKLSILRDKARVPVIVGFGIKEKHHVKEVFKVADGFVIGTKAVEMLEKGLESFKDWLVALEV